MTGVVLLWHCLNLILTEAFASEPKIIPLATAHGVQYVFAWLSENEERSYLLGMFLLFAGREVFGFAKLKFGKLGKQLETIKDVPQELKETREEIKELTKAFHKFERNIHKEIQDEVKYAFEMADRRKRP